MTGWASAQPLIAVDVGHGGNDTGAISARGRPEFDFNLDFAKVMRDALKARNFAVREVNFDGRVGGLVQRPQAAMGSDFFLSIHHDSISEAWLLPWEWEGKAQTYTEVKQGFGLFVSARNPEASTSLRCASTMGAMLKMAGFVPSQWHARRHVPADQTHGVWYYDNLVVLHRTTLPAVLFEAGVIKHREEELALRDPARQQRMAEAVTAGLAACLQIKETPVRDEAPPQTLPELLPERPASLP